MERIQQYLIQGTLGEGSFGSVYRAAHINDAEKRVAIKLLDRQLADIADVRHRFFQETLLLAKLEHPGIPKLLAFGPHETSFFLAEELADGPTLESRLSDERTLEESLAIVARILEVLAHAHQRGVAHRDLKSSDVIVGADGIKVLNLGLAKIVHGETDDDTGMRADLFSAGAILHELLTGMLPETAAPGSTKPARSLESLRSDLPPALIQFFRRCTANEPSERWPDAETALASLKSVRIAAPAPDVISDVDDLRIRIEPLFDLTAYPGTDDPLARVLIELEVRRTKQPAKPTNNVRADIFLVLDVSGSMEAADRYPLLRRAVDEFLRRMDPDDRVGIVVFSTKADGITPLIPGHKARDRASNLLLRMDRSSFMFGGGTHLAPGLMHAFEGLDATHHHDNTVKRIYVLTDGELHDEKSCEKLLPEIRRTRIEVHVYGFGHAFDAAALKRMVSDQLGGSVKPICNEKDIVATFSHIADVNRRLVMREGMLKLSFEGDVECGDAWSFRPQERWLGAIQDRRVIREIGGIEDQRTYALFAEVRLPPGTGADRTPVAKAELTWRDGDQAKTHTALIDVARAAGGVVNPRVEQAYAILDAMRNEGDREAELRSLNARLELARLEDRDPGLLAALQKQIDVFEGRVAASFFSDLDQQYLDADLNTNAGIVTDAELSEYLTSEARTIETYDLDD